LSQKDYIVQYKILKWLPGVFTHHWLITRDTGVGKTTSGFNPLQHQSPSHARTGAARSCGKRADH